jgi:dTDP-4-amino-4,6-dideoxygalactose transaminase
MEGLNSRLDELQAAILRVKLRHLSEWNARRREIAAAYTRALAGLLDIPRVTPGGESAHHLFPVLSERRDQLLAHLETRGVTALVHYPEALHLQLAYRGWGYGPGSFPAAEAAVRRVLSLPLFPQLADEEVEAVIAAVREFHA